ncbi:MAG: CoA ester lyase, partial [Butyricimonas virosa]|nr:CoA ester lyase [Butyricimonas virosa]MDY6220049.1 CoA ester lyase [Butyricimonas virosa]
SSDQVSWAEDMIRLSGEAIAQGKGVALKDNKFIGPPMVKMAKEILRKQGLIESRKNLRLNSSSCC